MRTYESIFIVHPEVIGDDQTALIDKYKTILSDQGADVLKLENWGTRTLAYQVKKQSKGCYVLVIFDAEPTVIAEFERRMRIDEKVIKFQTIILEGGYEAPPVVEAAPEEAPAEDAEATESATEAPAEAEAATEESTEES
ncbi:MAG: 30S ribosomal protein S6 [Desulfuromonadales bacterium]|jgi:small subunit ribosomal protein S6|nr:30S ribosomal protein S6 [Desulfuromonadales bacterium]MDH3807831.1 30S ribosomal protein S6 [Desulfuromonadales bacterium]MDH3868027.1 30S ribosomal protein S6 [Desulfuromonadales bacterium]MDH3960095.1 30S ribosomal protein S6 [Desulfuromonadales bacterium]MDH4024370.1 30S ribosomal protein S6 [Desulfuromonadales bacterium]